MTAPKRTRIVIEGESERDKQDMALLLALFFKERNIAIETPFEFGKATLFGMGGMFAHDVMMGKAVIAIDQAPPNPTLGGVPVLKVEVTSPPHGGGANLAVQLRNHLAQLPWSVELETEDLKAAALELGDPTFVAENIASLAENTDTKVVVTHRNLPYQR